MRHPMNLTFAFLLASTAPALVAQAPQVWINVLNRPQDNLLVQASLVSGADGTPYIQFRNQGQVRVNFHFGLKGGDPFTNRRIHLSPTKYSAYQPLPTGATVGTVMSSLRLAMVRKGPDLGPALPN